MIRWLICLAVLATGLTARSASPFEQGFAWTRSPSTDVPVYVLYHTTNAADLTFTPGTTQTNSHWNKISVTNFAWLSISATITNYYVKTNFVAGVTNWVMVTARDLNGVESEPSNVIPYKPPLPAGTLRLLLQTAPTPTGPWQTETNVPPIDLPIDPSTREVYTRLAHHWL